MLATFAKRFYECTLVGSAAFAVFIIAADIKTSSTENAPCDVSLWKHVYKPTRLQVHAQCATVTGVLVDASHGKRKDGVRKEEDGDCHGWIKLDPGQEALLNDGNKSNEEGNLVYEVVCMFPVKQADAKAVCLGYKNEIVLPPVGSHVRMSGSWVMDDNHARWNELHPVSKIEVIQ